MAGPKGTTSMGSRSGGNREAFHSKVRLNTQTAAAKAKKLTSPEAGREKSQQSVKGTGGRS